MASRKKGILSLVLTACLMVLAAGVAYSQQAKSEIREYEGTVKVAVGKYIYIPQAQGLDIYVADQVEGGLENLLGKEVKVKASLIPDKANLILAESIEIKEGSVYRTVYTRSTQPEFSDYLSPQLREEYEALEITNLNKPEQWEGKTKVKVYGQLQTSKVKEGGVEKEVMYIIITDKKGKEVAKIVANSLTDYAHFYMKKLRLFDKFWFYLNVKEQIDRKVRARTRELFKADVVFCGLF